MEILRALGTLIEPPEDSHRRVAAALELPEVPSRARFTEALVLQVYPYASVFLGEEGMLGGEARNRISGFWRALRLVPPSEPDHLTALIGLYSRLCEAQSAAADDAEAVLLEQARRTLVWEHLASWGTVFADALLRLGDAFYGAWAELFVAALAAEVGELGASDEDPGLPGYLDQVAGLGTFWDGAPEGVLAPARSGMVLTRADLALGAVRMGLGMRQGERAYSLKAMLGQAPQETRAWLWEEATAWGRRHAHRARTGVGYAAWWGARADAAARELSVTGVQRVGEDVS